MRPISRTHLARIAAVDISDAACKYLTAWWSEQERCVAACRTDEASRTVAAAALAVCGRCPPAAHQACIALARLDRYTGIAGGSIYINGEALTPRRRMM